MTDGPEPTPGRAPLGHPAEHEVPRHRDEPGRAAAGADVAAEGVAVEDTAAYELAVEDGRSLPPDDAPHAASAQDARGPQFREPGA